MEKRLAAAQKSVCDFTRNYIEKHGHAPHHREKDRLDLPFPTGNRTLELLPLSESSVSIPFLGTVAAGTPIEAIELPETIGVPESLLGKGENFALRVKGQSMIDEGIRDGDVLIVTRQAHAENGWMVVALMDGEATVKRLFRVGEEEVELRPSNASMAPIRVKASQVEIVGVIVGLLRQYRPAMG